MQYALHTTPFMRAYTLLLMAFDRFLAAMRPPRPMTRLAAVIAVVSGLIVICLGNSPTFGHYGTIRIVGETNATICINQRHSSGSRFVSRPPLSRYTFRVSRRRREIHTTTDFTDEFRNVGDANVSVTEVGVAGWAWWAWSTHA